MQQYNRNKILGNSYSNKHTHSQEEYFDPSYTEIERILDASTEALLSHAGYTTNQHSNTTGANEINTKSNTWPMKKEVMQVVSKLLNMRRDGFKISAFFTNPVDEEADGAVGYYDVIKSPMCFNTIRKKLANEEYTSVEQFGMS